MRMRYPLLRRPWTLLLLIVAVAGCTETDPFLPGGGGGTPSAPRDLEGFHRQGSVILEWAPGPGWDGETFRVYGAREGDRDFVAIAEVTSCSGGLCGYTDRNVAPGTTYLYYVSAVDPYGGGETSTAYSIEVWVPGSNPLPAPPGLHPVALDGAVYLTWDAGLREDPQFSHYRIYLLEGGDVFLLGETDSEGFLDERASNGVRYRYEVAAVDLGGEEGARTLSAVVVPRPDYRGEWIRAHEDRPDASGFRFPMTEEEDPIVAGTASNRHFRFETDESGWWLVPHSGVEIHLTGYETTDLRCGPGADFDCVALDEAPVNGYGSTDVAVDPLVTYPIRYRTGGNSPWRHGAVRISMQGFDQDGAAILIFDWVHQLDAGNPQLAPRMK